MPTQQHNLDKLRHSTAHLLAAAVLEIWPEAKPTIGPATDQGFYYDFDFGGIKISEHDFSQIETKMRELSKSWDKFERIEVNQAEALEKFANNPYKKELIHELTQQGQIISLYKSGNFIDLCRGGHIDQPAKNLQHFKLLSVAGAYWRGDEHNQMLTRIYGTAFATQTKLDEYLQNLAEAKQRDHKILGKKLDLFTFSPLVGAGLPLWTPKGTLLRNLLDDFVWQLRRKKGYQKVAIPHITKKDLYETSGHWQKFADDLFKIKTREDHLFAMKPMNCPHHTQIYAHLPRSYRELPQRYCETTMVYRDEQSGELSGLSRVRCITQDDAHVFCRESQVESEALAIWEIIETFYAATGFPQLEIRLSLHDPDNFQNYLGTKESWIQAEDQLRRIINAKKAQFTQLVGEAAFYGPKIDFIAHDSLGRQWQVATIQVDRNMPERFDLNCINENGNKERVVMLHAAIMGSIERFLSILIEHTAGAFPVWLAPVQVAIIPITDKQQTYAEQLIKKLQIKNIRTSLMAESESMQNKIRKAAEQKIPYMLIVGQREVEANQVSVRKRGDKKQEILSVEDFITKIEQEIRDKS